MTLMRVHEHPTHQENNNNPPPTSSTHHHHHHQPPKHHHPNQSPPRPPHPTMTNPRTPRSQLSLTRPRQPLSIFPRKPIRGRQQGRINSSRIVRLGHRRRSKRLGRRWRRFFQ